jgi:hypothetical protein
MEDPVFDLQKLVRRKAIQLPGEFESAVYILSNIMDRVLTELHGEYLSYMHFGVTLKTACKHGEEAPAERFRRKDRCGGGA